MKGIMKNKTEICDYMQSIRATDIKQKEVTKPVKKFLSTIGKKGGISADGDKKRRSEEHYKKMYENRRKKIDYICPNLDCIDDCRHRHKHKFDPENCTGSGTACPACVTYNSIKRKLNSKKYRNRQI